VAGGAGGVVMVVGSVGFLLGAAVAVPRVFTAADRDRRLRMLEERPVARRLGQPLYAAGALVAGLGVGVLAFESDPGVRAGLAAACGLLVLGAFAWSYAVYLRAMRPREFALGGPPGWPFAAYVWLTLAGLLVLGAALLLGGWPSWLGWLTLAGDAAFVLGYLRSRDIPPFDFYLLLAGTGRSPRRAGGGARPSGAPVRRVRGRRRTRWRDRTPARVTATDQRTRRRPG
jgi:hypothetical protein